jgi:hypothetical protein
LSTRHWLGPRFGKYWLQIEKAQGAANRVGFTANYKLLHRGTVLPSRNAEASALAQSDSFFDGAVSHLRGYGGS